MTKDGLTAKLAYALILACVAAATLNLFRPRHVHYYTVLVPTWKKEFTVRGLPRMADSCYEFIDTVSKTYYKVPVSKAVLRY